jgi:hypothetical protein
VGKSAEQFEQFNEIEAIVRSAGDYVRVSNELRPRVLEMARLANGERRARRCIRDVGLVAALLTWCVTASIGRLQTDDNLSRLALIATAPCSAAASEVGSSNGDAAWTLVDGFKELRVRQAAVLRLTF